MSRRNFLTLATIGLTVGMLTACSQIPTDKQSAVDLRPQISFRPVSDGFLDGRVYVDGLDVGTVSEYLENQSALKVLPGKHVVTVVLRDRTVYQETVYVGHGISRTIIVQ